MTLRVYERLQRELPRRDPRFRLGRCTVINDSLVQGIKALVAASQASDYLPGPFEPLTALQSEVTRREMKGDVWGTKQRIS